MSIQTRYAGHYVMPVSLRPKQSMQAQAGKSQCPNRPRSTCMYTACRQPASLPDCAFKQPAQRCRAGLLGMLTTSAHWNIRLESEAAADTTKRPLRCCCAGCAGTLPGQVFESPC